MLQEGNIVQWEKLTIAKPPVWDIVHHKRFITRDILCGLSGVIHSYDLTKASVYDINYLQDIKLVYHNCSIFGDRGYIGKEIQLDLFESANIKLECHYRLNQKDWKP